MITYKLINNLFEKFINLFNYKVEKCIMLSKILNEIINL